MFTIYTIGGGEFLVDFFNATAILVNSAIYGTAFKIVIVIGVMWYGFRASNGALKEAMRWLITTVLIIYMMVFAKASVIIEDRVDVSLAGNRIDNVPFGLAVIAGIASSVDHELTSVFEQLFALPDDLQYAENGFILGAKIAKETAFAEFAHGGGTEDQQRFKVNFQEFVEACVIINAQQGVPYNMVQLKTSENLWSLISDKSGLSPIFTFNFINSDNTTSLLTCKEGIDNISDGIEDQISATQGIIAGKLFPNHDDALDKFIVRHQSTLDYLTTTSQNAEAALRQAIMVNEIQQSMSGYAASLGNHAITPYEQARTELQQRSTYRIIGAQANSWLVLTKTMFEMMLYAFFPLVALYVVAPFGGISILKYYITSFAWLVLWSPCYAAINRLATGVDKYRLEGIYNDGITIANQFQIAGIQEQISQMAGYFSMLVPFITLVVFKGPGAMSSLAHKLGSVLESSAGQAASESSTGNTKIGDTSYNNLSANKQDSSHFFKGQGHKTEINNDGLAITTSASGQVSYNASGLTDNINTKFSASQQEMNNVSNAISSIESQTTNKAISHAVSNGFSVSSSDQYSQSEQDSIQESMNFMKSQSEDLSQTTGLSQSQVLEASAGIGVGFFKDKFSLNAKFGGSVVSDDAFRKLEAFAASEKFEEGMNYMKQNSQNESITYSDSNGDTVTSTMDEAMRKSQDYSNTLSNMQQISKIMSNNQTHEYIAHLHKNYDQHTVEGILNHKNNDYSGQRTESINSFMQAQPSISKNNFNAQAAGVGNREFLNKFEDNMNHQQGYSNKYLNETVDSMTKNAEWNMNNSKSRFEDNFEQKTSRIEGKTEKNVLSGSIDASLDHIKNTLSNDKDK